MLDYHTLTEMRLHDVKRINPEGGSQDFVMCVPAGWLYCIYNEEETQLTTTFVRKPSNY